MTVKMSQEFRKALPQSIETSCNNLLDMITIEMKKLAPHDTGALMQSIHRTGNGLKGSIVDGVPYGIFRNYNNNLHPNTKLYIERSVNNTIRGKSSQWWKASKSLYIS